MPPFRIGLLKRKIESGDEKFSTNEGSTKEESHALEDSDNLFRGDLDDANDATDSEPEINDDNDSDSNNSVDKVIFGDDADSTLGEDEDGEDSDQSSELTDSEADDEDDSEDNENESESEKSVDSGAESGPSQAQSSDEVDKQLPKLRKKTTNASKKQSKVKKQNFKNSVDILAEKIKDSSVSSTTACLPVEQRDEYESGDTSDEEDRRNTTGEVPRWWYDEYPHVGYDLDGRRIMKPPQRDQIDEFLKRCEDPDFWRTVKDPSTGQDVKLSKDDLELIRRLREGHVPDPAHDEYQPWVEWFSREVLATPLRAFPDHKRSFLPSRSDARRVAALVHALRMGWAKTRKQLADERRQKREKEFYNLWGSESEPPRGIHRHIPAPRRPLPSHAESYNPPPEYLLDKREMKEWEKLSATPWLRKYSFLPTRHDSLRAVAAHARYTRERFLRCLDLYLAPRAIAMRESINFVHLEVELEIHIFDKTSQLTIRPEELVPKLPSPRDLQPFPTREALQFRGHAAAVRCLHVHPSGQYLATGSDDRTVKGRERRRPAREPQFSPDRPTDVCLVCAVWEVSTGRCLHTVEAGEAVARVCWSPAAGLALLAAAAGARLLLLAPGDRVGSRRAAETTDRLLDEPPPPHDVAMDERTRSCVQWERVGAERRARGLRLALAHFKDIVHVAWHSRGDYVCVTLRDAASRSVVVHQLSRRRSQLPFRRSKGLVQCALFHPTKPWLFVATQRAVRIYDLARQELVRKLQPGAQWNSALAAHPGGDHLLVASYDSKCMWFDLELSARPYQTLRVHGRAVRAAAFHPRYPLFATGGDDRYIVVSHGMVYNDLLQNPLLVPLKQLPGGEPRDSLVTLDLQFHPTQPWLFAACADSTIRLYS
ncbi:unnamed protein product [Diatraea saccharalis]|uniref:Ribosome biogenesis protein BOP1 homolog n=1 Tax=Diatraea saccharalis TaxID=40085 RepID=A0A9P0FZS7_9NEOP|nr:unnamed protein product [Diatraea saccharalis]